MNRLILTVIAAASMAITLTAGPRQEALKAVNAADLQPREREALEFLYRYMPLPDVAAHDASFYIDNVRTTFAAADSLGWNVPEREFRHFVLPLRVNNEALDSCRSIFFAELLPRVKGKTMEEAILEVNHWCHEKVTYKPSDPRTSSPLQSVCNAVGRCGEESTLGVAALRAVGIPARQVYTPRWAHTDDNHAWVEAWANGKWHFLGACEPEAVLDLAWFNEPASRGVLMSTKVFGAYDGPEEVLSVTPLTTEINVTSNYAPTGLITATVTDADGKPVENATVRFSLYNYAEYFPLTVKKTAADGTATFLCGQGDVVVWATDGTRFGFAKANPAGGAEVTVPLKYDGSSVDVVELDLVPPAVGATLPRVTAEQAAENDRRKVYEDSIRGAYAATFATEAQARAEAARLDIDADRWAALQSLSRGNHARLLAMMESFTETERPMVMAMLEAMTEKDLGDIRPEIVRDAMATARNVNAVDSATFVNYILNPRVSWEPLSASRRAILKHFGDRADEFAANPALWVKWVSDSVAIVPAENPNRFEMRPEDVARWRMADTRSRNIFFVSAARAFGIPAQIDPVTGKLRYLSPGATAWTDVDFGEAEPVKKPVNPARLVLKGEDGLKYFLHFSVGRIENGLPNQLDFDDFHSVEVTNKALTELDPGQYIITTGQRLADGSVLARSELIMLPAGETVEYDLVQRHNPEAIEVIGQLDAENLYQPLDGGEPCSILSTTGRGFYVLGIIAPGHEPSAHALNDFAAAAADLEKTGRKIVLLFPDAEAASRFDAGLFRNLPSNISWGIDIDGKILNEIVENQRLSNATLPIVVVADTFNRVVNLTQGYTIGLGDRLASLLNRL